jgi:hypothetical protein
MAAACGSAPRTAAGRMSAVFQSLTSWKAARAGSAPGPTPGPSPSTYSYHRARTGARVSGADSAAVVFRSAASADAPAAAGDAAPVTNGLTAGCCDAKTAHSAIMRPFTARTDTRGGCDRAPATRDGAAGAMAAGGGARRGEGGGAGVCVGGEGGGGTPVTRAAGGARCRKQNGRAARTRARPSPGVVPCGTT